MNKVVYVFNDGTKTSSYCEANKLKEEKGNYTVDFVWEDIKETDELLKRSGTTKSSKPIKSNNRN